VFVGPKGKGKAKAAARANTAEVVDASPAAESAFTETPTPLVSVVVENRRDGASGYRRVDLRPYYHLYPLKAMNVARKVLCEAVL
jgi:hypothetical protein